MFRNPLMAACFLNASLNCHVRYERTIYRLGKTTHTWSRIVIISNFWTKCTSCQLRITEKSNLKVKILKIFAGVFSCCLAHEIKPQQRICVCLGQITIFRNFMNEDSQKKRQQAFLKNTFVNTCPYSFLKTKCVQFFCRGKLHASNFAQCASY